MSNLATYRLLSKLRPPRKSCNIEGTDCAVSNIKLIKIWTPEKFAVIILKVEQDGFNLE